MEKEKEPAEWTSIFNPFNSWKLLAQIPRWKEIKKWREGNGKIPAPTTISVDPANICNLKCKNCNADFLMQRNHNLLSRQTLTEIANFLPTWGDGRYDVEAVCVGGGGESLLNPYTGEFLRELQENNIGTGVVTNGTKIHKNIEALANCDWVGVSVDAGNRNTYNAVKGADKFSQVIQNIQNLNKKIEGTTYRLNGEGKGHGISYKYLLRPETVAGVYQATKIAKGIGCRSIHIRPIAPSWDKVNGETNLFKEEDIYRFKRQLSRARELEDKNFHIYGVTHKFNNDFTPSHNFDNCYAIHMSAILMPPTNKNKGKFDLGVCCDNRGNNLLTMRNITSVPQIKDYWGSKAHKDLMDKIDVHNCPRCTFAPHNQIYENAVKVNNMTPDFI